MFRDGAVAALAADGRAVQTPTDVVAWALQAREAIVILTVRSEDDWDVLERLHEINPATCSVVVLLDEESIAAGVRAVRAGARSVLMRNASPDTMRRTAAALLDGQSVLPAAVVAAFAAGGEVPGSRSLVLSTEQISWLRALAAGQTVAQLAEQVGYSERAMFRLLRTLYREMGVRGRVEALMIAQANGWLRSPARG